SFDAPSTITTSMSSRNCRTIVSSVSPMNAPRFNVAMQMTNVVASDASNRHLQFERRDLHQRLIRNKRKLPGMIAAVRTKLIAVLDKLPLIANMKQEAIVLDLCGINEERIDTVPVDCEELIASTPEKILPCSDGNTVVQSR